MSIFLSCLTCGRRNRKNAGPDPQAIPQGTEMEVPDIDDTAIVPAKGFLGGPINGLPTYQPKNEQPQFFSPANWVVLTISDVLLTMRNECHLARCVLFETARLQKSLLSVGLLKLSDDARVVDMQLIELDKTLVHGDELIHGSWGDEDIEKQNVILKGDTFQKALLVDRITMNQHQQLPGSDGLQVDMHEQAAKAPEVVHDQNSHYYTPTGYEASTPAGYEALGPKEQRPPFGLGLWGFAGLIAFLTAIIVGAGVGGGLGAALASKSGDSSAEPTSCPTLDNSTSDTAPYVPKAASDVTNLQLNCPEKLSDEQSHFNTGYQFRWWCGVNAPLSEKAKEGGTIFDYVAFFSYSIEDCMGACVNMNTIDDKTHTGLRCRSVVFATNMSAVIETKQYGNCWLKNGTKAKGSNWEFKKRYIAYAELID
ncbi:unnamed protein product [Fusarium graminearum]|nr:unnamed protein product [Fusarium graminearum]CAG1995033.1 unnamed protein product [Fusarium graminearum]